MKTFSENEVTLESIIGVVIRFFPVNVKCMCMRTMLSVESRKNETVVETVTKFPTFASVLFWFPVLC